MARSRQRKVRLEGSRLKLPPRTWRVRPCRLDEKVTIDIHVRRPPGVRPPPGVNYWIDHPPGHRRYLTQLEFAAQHSASAHDLELIEDFCRSNRLKVEKVYPDRRIVTASGPARRMNSAFCIDLGYYRSPTEIYRGREGDIFVPQLLEPIIQTVVGLEKRPLHRDRNLVRLGASIADNGPRAQSTSTIDPKTVLRFYNFPAGNGSGQTVGVLELAGGYVTDKAGRPADIDAYLDMLRLPRPIVVSVNAGARNRMAGSKRNVEPGDPDVEVTLDIAMAAAAAPAVKIAVYFAPNHIRGLVSGLAAAIHDRVNSPSVISISWGSNESGWTDATCGAFHELLRDAASLGITVLASSGDDGTNAGAFDGKPHVNYPASDPWVTACGGTVVRKRSGQRTVEHSWGHSGGGFSKKYRQPRWQDRVSFPPSVHRRSRGVPDVAGNAGTGYNLVVYGTPTTRLRMSAGNDGSSQAKFVGPVTGTSAVAPLYAGLLALINGRLSQRVGYLNPSLYLIGLRRRQKTFRKPFDRVVVTNAYQRTIVDPKTGAPIQLSTPGFAAIGNWNAVTGLGRIDGNELLQQLMSL
jgi:kumamolisin